MRATSALGTAVAVVAASITLGAVTAFAVNVDLGATGRSDAKAARAASRLLTPITTNGSWPVYHRDNGHTGNDPTVPTVAAVTSGWTSGVLDAEVYASTVVYGGIVYAATLNNTVYALNQTDGSPVWSNHLGTPVSTGWGCGNVSPLGILGTPAIDPATGRIFVTVLFDSDDLYRVYGLNLLTGAIEVNVPLTVSGGAAVMPGFDWTIQQERGALAVGNGYVYVPFGGRAGDCGNYSGWVVGIPTSGTGATHVYRTPGIGNGIWNAGGVVIDDSTGKVFAPTGNGDVSNGCAAITGNTPQFENDAVVRLSPTMAEEDFFMPDDWQANWCQNDQDLGSISPVLISPTLMFQTGKWGMGFLLDPTNLGGVDGQRFPTPKPATYAEAPVCLSNVSDATFGGAAYSSSYIYLECDGHGLVALKLDTSVPSSPSFTPCTISSCSTPNWHVGGTTTYGPPIVAGGAVWVASNGGGLFAYGASTGALLFHSAGFGINRFVTPSEAGGQVFVPSHTVIRSFRMQFGASQSQVPPAPPARPSPVTQAGAPAPGTRPPASQSSPAPSPRTR